MLSKKTIILIILTVFILLSCNSKVNSPKALKGVIDLSHWDFAKDGIIGLDGEWEFYWKKFLNPEDFNDKSIMCNNYITSPKSWNNIIADGEKIGPYGYATLRLTVLLNAKYEHIMSLKIYEIATAYALFINGKRNLDWGKAATSVENNIPQNRPATTIFEINDNKIEIIMHVSNYTSKYGGFCYHAPYLGTYNQIKDNRDLHIIFQIFLFGCILIIGFFHLILFLLRREDVSSLIFGLFCICISPRLLVTGDVYLIYNFINISSDNNTRLQYLTFFLGVPLYNSFLYSVFKNTYYKYILYFIICISVLHILFTFIVPLKSIAYIFVIYQFFIYINILYLIYVSIYAVIKKQEDASVFIGGFLILTISVVNDMLYNEQIIHTLYLMPAGLLIFILAQSIILSMKFAKAYKNIEDYSHNLEQKVKERTAQLEKAAEEKTNFFIKIAHETKTPLTLINNYLHKFIRKNGSSEEMIIIRENLDKLLKDMVDFLDIEKFDKGKIIFNHDQIINLPDILKKKLIMFGELALNKNIELTSEIDDDIYAKIDPNALDRIINNIMDNAVKYTNSGGQIHFQLKQKDEKNIITIKDTGIGMTPLQISNIFDSFYQASHDKKNTQGIGIGLSIVKRIVDNINGQILVESIPDEGSSFMIIFDKYVPEANDFINTLYEPSKPLTITKIQLYENNIYDKSKYNLMIVDDNPEMLAYLVDSMKDQFNIFFATNGLEALTKIENIPKPDLILSDIMMDVMDGYEFFEKLTAVKKYSGISFIFLTARTSIDEKIKSLSNGAVDFISKPFNIDELQAKILSIIKKNKTVKINSVKKALYKNNIKLKMEKMVIFEKRCSDFNITSREKQIINSLLDGKINKEICSDLNISIKTLKNHITNIYKKCSIQNRIELVNIFTKKSK